MLFESLLIWTDHLFVILVFLIKIKLDHKFIKSKTPSRASHAPLSSSNPLVHPLSPYKHQRKGWAQYRADTYPSLGFISRFSRRLPILRSQPLSSPLSLLAPAPPLRQRRPFRRRLCLPPNYRSLRPFITKVFYLIQRSSISGAMASSILSGDRRCSTVRGKMTVIGKLPKPINLPSQKLENRGLDPNVEIVPKGTLTWGSKSSVPTPNAWTSSALSSPYTDGTASSPVTGRPSSGGGGPRPSTSGSDRSREAVSSAWGSNSRPSSASGILVTNQTSLVASRPQSAETRPGSSQLSRFAENSSENTTQSWAGNTGTAERAGSGTSKSSGFMLISGEFPSLGSEKNPEQQMQRGHSSQGRPTSASSSSAQKESFGNPADGKIEPCAGNNNSGKIETQHHVGGGPPPNNENWQRNPLQGQPYPTVNMPPPQFDTWGGPPVRPPDGIWYTVGTAGGPFRPAGPPGSYPIDHFAFYPSQPPGPLPNSQPVPRPGPSLGVHYLKNGEAYRPQLSQESYAVPNHPIISVRPGLYQSPPYDGYLGPRASFCNPTDREVPTRGTVGPVIYNQFNKNANVEPGKFLARSDIHPSIIAKEQVKSGQFSEIHQGQYKVLLKQHDSFEGKDVEEKKEQSTLDSSPHSEERKQYDSITHEDGMRNRCKDEGSAFAKAVPLTETSRSASDWDGRSSNANTKNSLKDSSKISNEGLVKRPDGFTGVPGHEQQPYSVVKKDASLMGKIEVLNNKARYVDGDCEGAQFPSKEVKNHKVLESHIENPVQVLCTNNNSSRTSGTYTKGRSVSYQTGASKAEKVQFGKVIPQPLESQVITVSVSACPEDSQKLRPQVEKRVSVTQGLLDDHTQSGPAGQNDNGSINRTSGRSSSETVPSRRSEIGTVTNLPDCHTSQEMVEKLERAKQKELAAQRAKQLRKEEEERNREQKAKAQAKLVELNRRSLVQAVDQNPNSAATSITGGQLKQDFGGKSALRKDNAVNEAPVVGVLAVTTAVVNPSTNSEVRSPGWSRDPSLHVASQPSKLSSCTEGHELPQDCSLGHDGDISEHVTHKTSPHFQENNFSKHKRLGYRKKQTSLQEKNPCGQPVNMGDPENCSEVPVQELAVEALSVISEMPMQHKKKNNRTTKNKMKMEEAPSGSTLPSSAQNEINDDKCSIDDRKTQSSASVADVMPNPSQIINEILESQTSKDVVPSSYPEGSARVSEEHHGRINNQWKSQSSRRSTRYQQGIRTGEKFHGSEAVIWAPVKPQSRISLSDEANQKNGNESSVNPSTNSGHDAQNGVKTKRAEMERYVPKPVAKELPFLNSQHNSSTINLAASSDVTVGPDSGGPGVATDFKNGDDTRPNRRSKTHASRRQQNSDGLARALRSSSHEGSVSSYPANPSGKHYDQHQLSKFDGGSEEQFKCDDLKGNFHNPASIEALPVPVLKDHSVINKQQYQRYKPAGSSGHTASLNYNKVPHNGSHDKCDSPSSGLQLNEVCATDALGNASPHFGSENKKSHWQPKSQPQSNKHGQRATGNQRAPLQSGQFGNELHPQSIGNHSSHFESNNPCTVNVETGNASKQEAKQEVKASGELSRERIHLPNHPTNVELPPQVDSQQEQLVSATFRRHGTNSGRLSRGQESIHRGRDVGQDAGRLNSHLNGHKLNNSRFEYQQSGSHKKSRDSSQYDSAGSETQEVPRAPGPRIRGRGQNNSKRGGNFYGRNSGAGVGASHYYNSGE
ncbi:putative protein modifier of SNC1 1 [Dioscorea sansibarensis]